MEDGVDHRDDADLRRRVLDRLVDEQLLAQGALELGLPLRDARLREQIASAMSDAVMGEALDPPGDDALRACEVEHAASFTRRGRLRVEAVYFRGPGAFDRADAARARLLLGQGVGAVAQVADPPPAPVPREPVAVATLIETFGPAAAMSIDALAPGEVTEPILGGEDAWVVRLASREGGELAPLAEVRGAVTARWRGEETERRLRRWLDRRRGETRVVVGEVLP